MCRARSLVFAVVLLAGGCGAESTAQLIEQLKAPAASTRLKAARTLAERKDDAVQVIPALVEALQDEDAAVRRSAAFGLGTFGEAARSATPALQAARRDRAASVRKAAAAALRHIDPAAAPRARGSGERRRGD